jgi:hypothetical protein
MIESADSKYRRYLEQRQEYAKAASDHLTRFERTILLANGAGLTAIFSLFSASKLSLTWSTDLASLCFAGSFGAMLISHYFSYLDNEAAIISLDASYDNEQNFSHARWYSKFIEPLNWFSLLILMVGYAMFAYSIDGGA